MKKLKSLMLISAVLAVICLSACVNPNDPNGGDGKHKVYTNIPQGSFEIEDDEYSLGSVIEGYNASPADPPQVDTANYSSLGYYYYSMNADAQVVVSDNFGEEGAQNKFTEFTKEVGDILNSISKSLSPTVVGSDIYNFNTAAAGAEIEISQTAYEVLNIAKSVYTLTDGSYNPALYYNIEAYGFGNTGRYPEDASALPSDAVITQYTSLASHFGEIVLRDADGKYYVQKPAATVNVGGADLTMKLDLGGIGKGYAVDKVDGLFDKYGYRFGYFNFGTSSMLVKSHFTEGVYNLSFAGPRSPQRKPYMSVTVRNEKFSTSGDSEQYYILNGTRYCHVINPKTGKPVQTGIMTATVIGGSAAEADALTTAIMAMEKEDAIRFIRENLTDKRVAFAVE